MAEEVAKAYIQLIPSASGIKAAITKELGGDVETAGSEAGGRFSKAFGGALAGLGAVVTGAVAAGAAAAGKLTKDAVSAFADYEQLVGGVETLFKYASDTVQKNAAEAFKTAGLSANEYMETVTGFSASLLQSLNYDRDKAAEVADMAIRDMADNANKMGTSMESIQNAYQGFAKQNYTMLDNLKLGYGGTKQEMERLLEDARALSGVEYNIDNLSDVYEAIHVIQAELDITGTTAKEASETISGSVAAMKSAWENLIAGLANDNADLDALISDVVESAETALGNIMPAAQTALEGIAELIEKLAPIIADKLPALVSDILPPLIKAASSIAQGLLEALPDVLAGLIEALPDVLAGLAEALPNVLTGLTDVLPDLINTIIETIVESAPEFTEIGVQFLLELIQGFAENIDELIPAVAEAIRAIIEALTEPETLEQLVEAAVQLIIAIGKGLIEAIPVLLDALTIVIANVIKAIGALGKEAFLWGRDLIDNFVEGIKERIQRVIETIREIAQSIRDLIGFSEPKIGPLSNFHTFPEDMMKLFADEIRDHEHLITDQIARSFDVGPQIVDYGFGNTQTPSLEPYSETRSASPDNTLIGGNIVFNVTETIDGRVLARNM